MTFQGDKIIGKPTISLIEVFIAKHGLFCEPQDVYYYWDKKKWLTKKGKEVKTLEAAINVYNSIAVQREVKRQLAENNFKNKEERLEKEKEIIKSLKFVKKIKEAPKPDVYMPYKGQLSDERWSAFRNFIFIVRGKSCETCGSKKSLQVHHLQYKTGAFAWEYNCNEVVVLCKECHKKIHELK